MSEHVIPALATKASAAAVKKSCTSCIFYTPGSPATEWSPAMPGVCSTYGNQPVDLSIMTQAEAEAARQMVATHCKRYNDRGYRALPTSVEISVGVPKWNPDEEVINSLKQAQCNSCLSCVNWVEGYTDKVGLTPRTGLCVAKGSMIPRDKARDASRNCRFRQNGSHTDDRRVTNLDDIEDYIVLKPTYNLETVRASMHVEEVSAPGGLPSGYEPDKYVAGKTPNEFGVAGTVKITDPSGSGNYIELPVFGDVFDETESAKIPRSSSDERPDLYIDWEGLTYALAVAWSSDLDETPALIGPAGVGKTELYRHLAWIMRLPFERISITGSTDLDDLQGSVQFVDNETKFKLGRVPLCWKKPCVLLIDEPNVGPREVWQFLRPLTDNSKQLVIDADDGVPIKRNDFCYLGFAMNPQWDIKNDGTIELADADIRRLFHVFVGYPGEEVEATIIKNHCKLASFDIPDELMRYVQNVGQSLRNQADAGDIPISWGLGQQIKVSKLLNWFMPIQAYSIAAGNYLEPELKQRFLAEVIAGFPHA